MPDIDVNFLARQLDRVLTEIGSLRNDMTVLSAMAMRQDTTLAALLVEMRAVHGQIGRMNDSLRILEDEEA